jgi:hypothetical protein
LFAVALPGITAAQPLLSADLLRAELLRTHALVLQRPADTELSLRYARLAEQLGEPRKALSAYERVIANDPTNPEALQGLVRIRRKLQPQQTLVFTEFGAAWESNPRRVPDGARSEWEAIARIMVRDERALGNMRWRTEANFIAEAHEINGDLNYGYAGGITGPVIDLTPYLAMHAALGGGVAYFDHRFLYSEATAALAFETFFAGATQSLRFRAAYRNYNDFFPSSHGPYADIVGRLVFPNITGSGDLLVLNSWLRWSDIAGDGITITFEQVQPGKYVEYGGRLEYYRRLLDGVTIGGSFGILGRDYAESFNLVPPMLPSTRRDVTISPGATVIFHHVFGHHHDIRIDYRYEDNRSSDPLRDYLNHLVSMLYLVRF